MTLATLFFLGAFVFALWYTVARVGARPSVTLLLLGGLLVIHGLPMLVYMNWTGPDTLIYEVALAYVDREEVFTRLLMAMGLTYVGVTAGVAAVRAAVSLTRGEGGVPSQAPDWSAPLRQVYQLGPLHRLVLWAMAALMAAVILTEGQAGKIATYFLAASNEADQLMLRVEGGGTPYYFYNVFLYALAPLAVMALWCARRFEPADLGLASLLAAMALLTLIGKMGTLSKAPPVIFILQLAFLGAVLGSQRIRLRELLGLGALLLVLFGLVVALTFPNLDFAGILRFLHYRALDIPNEGLVEYFAAFPQVLPHTWEYGLFGSLHRPTGMEALPNYFAVAEISRGSILSSSNVMFLGDAWADWGWAGVLAFPFAAGALVQAVDLYAGRNGRTDEWACITAACSFSIFAMLSTALPTALITGGLALIPVASWMMSLREPIFAAPEGEPAPPPFRRP